MWVFHLNSREMHMPSIVAGMLLVLLVTGCATSAPLTEADSGRIVSLGAATEYRLGIADKIKLTVYREETLTGEYSVEADGKLAIPVVGRIEAAGKTADEIAEQVRAALARGYLREPQVVAQVIGYRPYFILGEVNKPGKYDYSIGLTVLAAVATAEGFSYRANEKRVFIKSQDDRGEKAMRITPDLAVKPGDVIRIESRSF